MPFSLLVLSFTLDTVMWWKKEHSKKADLSLPTDAALKWSESEVMMQDREAISSLILKSARHNKARSDQDFFLQFIELW